MQYYLPILSSSLWCSLASPFSLIPPFNIAAGLSPPPLRGGLTLPVEPEVGGWFAPLGVPLGGGTVPPPAGGVDCWGGGGMNCPVVGSMALWLGCSSVSLSLLASSFSSLSFSAFNYKEKNYYNKCHFHEKKKFCSKNKSKILISGDLFWPQK